MFSSKTKEKNIFAAYDHFALGRYSKALKEFEEYYALYPDSTSSLNIIGTLHYQMKDKKKAESVFLKLIQKLEETGEYDKVFPVINKLAFVIEDHDRLYQMRADLYSKKDRNELAIRQLLVLAERYRHSGNFDACNNLYLDIARKNSSNYRVINKIIQKLSLMGSYQAISEVLTKSTEHDLFPVDELDHIIVFLIESGAKPENVVPFIRGFLSRHPSSFNIAEEIILEQLKKEFNADLFNFIADTVPMEYTREFTFKLKELVSDVAIVKHALRLEAKKGSRDIIKGLIFELYVDSGLKPHDIAEICIVTGTYVAFEEMLKIGVSFMDKKELVSAMEKLAFIYKNSGEDARAEAISVYARYNKIPESLSEIFSQPPEDPVELEHRLDVRTSVKETVVELAEETPEEEAPSGTADSQQSEVVELIDIDIPDSAVFASDAPFELETHAYGSSEPVKTETISLDSYGDFDAPVSVKVDLEIADDFGHNLPSGSVSASSVDGLETFFVQEKAEPDVSGKQDNDLSFFDTPVKEDKPYAFAGFDGVGESYTNDTGFKGFDDVSVVKQEDDFFTVKSVENPAQPPQTDDFSEGMVEEEEKEQEVTVVKLDIDESDIAPHEPSAAKDDYFAGMEVEIQQKVEPERIIEVMSFDEKELEQAKSKNDDFFSQEI